MCLRLVYIIIYYKKIRFATGSFYLINRRVIKFNEYGFTVILRNNKALVASDFEWLFKILKIIN